MYFYPNSVISFIQKRNHSQPRNNRKQSHQLLLLPHRTSQTQKLRSQNLNRKSLWNNYSSQKHPRVQRLCQKSCRHASQRFIRNWRLHHRSWFYCLSQRLKRRHQHHDKEKYRLSQQKINRIPSLHSNKYQRSKSVEKSQLQVLEYLQTSRHQAGDGSFGKKSKLGWIQVRYHGAWHWEGGKSQNDCIQDKTVHIELGGGGYVPQEHRGGQELRVQFQRDRARRVHDKRERRFMVEHEVRG